MADRTTQLMLEGLGRAMAEPSGLPLFVSKSAPGLFPANPAGRLAAQASRDRGLLRVVSQEYRGRSPTELLALTESGLNFLLDQSNPRQILEDLIRTLDARRGQLDQLVATARQMQQSLDVFRGVVEKALQSLPGGTAPGAAGEQESADRVLMEALISWHSMRRSEDCPLPELFRRSQAALPELSVGEFHDGLRQLHEQQRIYLHPWTGPLYAIPEPPFALLVGHEVAYYSSLRGHAA